MVEKKKPIILSGGNRRDIEQIGASLLTNDVLGRSFASSSVFRLEVTEVNQYQPNQCWYRNGTN
jgi:hypothetical protein